jgi:hypothetical protein
LAEKEESHVWWADLHKDNPTIHTKKEETKIPERPLRIAFWKFNSIQGLK